MANSAFNIDQSLSFSALSTAPNDPKLFEIYNDKSLGLLIWNGVAWIPVVSSVNVSAAITIASASISSGVNIPYDTIVYDRYNTYDSSTNDVTVPFSGKYHVSVNVDVGSNALDIYIAKNGVIQFFLVSTLVVGGIVSGSGTIDCIAGDKISVQGDGGAIYAAGSPPFNSLNIDRVG